MAFLSKLKKKLDKFAPPDPLRQKIDQTVGKFMKKGGGGSGPAMAPQMNPNPFAQFGTFQPGIGYVGGAQNPFAGILQNLPPGLLQSPQAMQVLTQALGGGGTPQAAPAPSPGPTMGTGLPPQTGFSNPFQQLALPQTPGPAPSGATQMGAVGGFGNGGGKMTIPGARFLPRTPMRAK